MTIQVRPYTEKLKETYSDLGLKIQKVGSTETPYDSAVDWNDSTYQYVETDITITPHENEGEQHEGD